MEHGPLFVEERQRARILVVEDDLANQKVAELFLRKLGYQVELASNGQQAIELCKEADYDLVLMDCQMPIMDGFETTRQLRQKCSEKGKIPIVALTANVVSGINQQCRDAGMDDVLNKPIGLDTLKHMLEKWLKD